MTDKLIPTTEHRGPWLAPWRRPTVTRAEAVLERPLYGHVRLAFDPDHDELVAHDDLGALLTWQPTVADLPLGTTITLWRRSPENTHEQVQHLRQHRDRPEPPFWFWALWMVFWVLSWRGVYSAFDWDWGALHWAAVVTGVFTAYCIRRVRMERRSARHQAASEGDDGPA